MAEVYKQIYKNYIRELVKSLPMDDVNFITELSADDLLPGDIQAKLTSLATSAEKSSHFLVHVIKPALDTGYTEGFDKLLKIMKNCEFSHVQAIAAKITSDIVKANGPATGMYLCSHTHPCGRCSNTVNIN